MIMWICINIKMKKKFDVVIIFGSFMLFLECGVLIRNCYGNFMFCILICIGNGDKY